MPAKLMRKSAISDCLRGFRLSLQLTADRRSRKLAILHSHDRGCRASRPNAVANGVNASQSRLELRIDCDKTFGSAKAQKARQRGLLLTDCLDDLIRF